MHVKSDARFGSGPQASTPGSQTCERLLNQASHLHSSVRLIGKKCK